TIVARGVVLAMLLGFGLLTVIRDDRPGQAAAFGLACLAILLVSPLAWGHYYVWVLPAAVCVPYWLAHRGRAGLAWLCAAVPALLTVAHYAAIRWTGPIGLLGVGTTAWFVLVCALAPWVREWVAPGEPAPAESSHARPALARRGEFVTT